MTEEEVKITIGGLLHDVGKVIYRTGNSKSHSESGYEFLLEEVKLDDKDVLEAVLYHHKSMLAKADIEKNSFAYITYIADNIASAMDRRKKENEDYGFEKTMPLQPVFNILNGNHKEFYYHPQMITEEPNYPSEEKKAFDDKFYQEVERKIKNCLDGIEWNDHYINSLLSVLETTTGFIPSSTARGEVADISLYDHSKMTAAVGGCIYKYLQEQNISDYKQELLNAEDEFFEKNAFLLYSADLSGIQNFIYTIHSKDALKMLRARSFYLEIVMEHIIDTLLEKIGLSRANLIYSGGGHCYILFPNTDSVKQILDDYETEINEWFLKNYDVAIYMASGYAEASANCLKNYPEQSYSTLFKTVSERIGEKKAHRYNFSQIIELNNRIHHNYDRECRICKRLENVNSDMVCETCSNLLSASKDILYQPFFTVINNKTEDALILPGDKYLVAESENAVKNRIAQNDDFVRAYSKNKYYTGVDVATKIWVGDYTQGQTFEELADSSTGISRLGVLRADVDNLGQTFVGGFAEQYNTLSRTATLSRHLSIFFKYYINKIIDDKNFTISDVAGKHRNATIVYSGGDDLFIVGAWNEIHELAVDIRRAFERYTEGTLSISAGIGLYPSSYPISRIAVEVGDMENLSKNMDGKNSVTIMPKATFTWKIFEDKVVGEKIGALSEFFANSEDRGKNFLYNLLELLRGRGEKINFARYVYLLSRMEPDKNASDEARDNYRRFSKKMYQWMQNDEDCVQLISAINMYAYLIREREGDQK